MRGVIRSAISVLLRVKSLLVNNFPSHGSSANPGTFVRFARSSSLINPARTCVSPSFSASVVAAVRVPNLISETPVCYLYFLYYIADLKADLHRYLVLQGDRGLHVQLEPYIQIAYRGGDAYVGSGGGGDNRHLVADEYFCLLTVFHPNAGIGKNVDNCLGLLEIDYQCRVFDDSRQVIDG